MYGVPHTRSTTYGSCFRCRCTYSCRCVYVIYTVVHALHTYIQTDRHTYSEQQKRSLQHVCICIMRASLPRCLQVNCKEHFRASSIFVCMQYGNAYNIDAYSKSTTDNTAFARGCCGEDCSALLKQTSTAPQAIYGLRWWWWWSR